MKKLSSYFDEYWLKMCIHNPIVANNANFKEIMEHAFYAGAGYLQDGLLGYAKEINDYARKVEDDLRADKN